MEGVTKGPNRGIRSVAGPDYGEWTFHKTFMLICSDLFKDIYTSDFCRKDGI